MPCWMIVYLVATAVVLILSLTLLFIMLKELSKLSTEQDRNRDELCCVKSMSNKFDEVIKWFLAREGLEATYEHSCWRWFIRPIEERREREALMSSEERRYARLADAIYKAYLTAMRTFADEQLRAKTREASIKKKALRGTKK